MYIDKKEQEGVFSRNEMVVDPETGILFIRNRDSEHARLPFLSY